MQKAQEINCNNCKDAGVIITKTMFEGDKPHKHYFVASCKECGRGTDARSHIMMHSQLKDPCDCEYKNILNYWNKCNENKLPFVLRVKLNKKSANPGMEIIIYPPLFKGWDKIDLTTLEPVKEDI